VDALALNDAVTGNQTSHSLWYYSASCCGHSCTGASSGEPHSSHTCCTGCYCHWCSCSHPTCAPCGHACHSTASTGIRGSACTCTLHHALVPMCSRHSVTLGFN
jgi:hypothetical protein